MQTAGWIWALNALQAAIAVFIFYAVIEVAVRAWQTARRWFRRRRDGRRQ
jgi:hypothetical protein